MTQLCQQEKLNYSYLIEYLEENDGFHLKYDVNMPNVTIKMYKPLKAPCGKQTWTNSQ